MTQCLTLEILYQTDNFLRYTMLNKQNLSYLEKNTVLLFLQENCCIFNAV